MVLLGGVVILCWLGVIGMWKMKEPVQALHYLSLPATAGAVLLTIAVLIVGRPGASILEGSARRSHSPGYQFRRDSRDGARFPCTRARSLGAA